jgi:hypothetical protein
LTRIGVDAIVVNAERTRGAAVNTPGRNVGVNKASTEFQIGGVNASRIDQK